MNEMVIEAPKIDPMRVLDTAEVERRTGLSRRTIDARLSLDRQNRTPGVNFAAPITNRRGKREWREITIIRWMEKREAKIA